MPLSLSPEQRSLRASLAAHEMHGRHDPRETTRAARAASPGSLTYWERKVEEERPGLPDDERTRRAGHLRAAHMRRLALASSRARAARRAP